MAKWKVVLTDREFESIDIEKEVLAKVDAELVALSGEGRKRCNGSGKRL